MDIDAILEKCLPYFDSWVLVAHSLIRVEFPSFEVSQSFNVFDMIEKEQPDIDQLVIGCWYSLSLTSTCSAWHQLQHEVSSSLLLGRSILFKSACVLDHIIS